MWPHLRPGQDALALALRGMIAEFSGIQREFVRASASFEDLDIGPADSIDEVDFVLRLETVIGRDLSAAERERIPSPDLSDPTIATFVLGVCSVVAAGAK